MKVTIYETLYHEDHGATLKHKCGKRDSSIVPSLFFSHFIFFFSFSSFFLSFLWPSLFFLFGLSLFFLCFLFFSFCKVRSLIPTCGGIIVFIILSSLRQWSNNEDHHTFMDLQLKNYNSKTEQDMTLYECLWRCTGIWNESRVTCMKTMKVVLPQIRCQLHDHAKSNMTMMERVIINGKVESFMAIYLGMAMKMP